MIRSRLPLFLGCATLAFSLATAALSPPAQAEDTATAPASHPNAARPLSPEHQKMREDMSAMREAMLKLNKDTQALIDKCIPTKSENVTECLQEKKILADRRADLMAKRATLREGMMAAHKERMNEHMKGMRGPMSNGPAADMPMSDDAKGE